MSDLERRLAALEKSARELTFAGAALNWTPFTGKPAENESTATPETQLSELEHQWRECNIVGDGAVLVTGNMGEGWAVSGTGLVDGASLGGGTTLP